MATTVILGTGIIGVSTAYYLSLTVPGPSIHLVEASPTLFASASGFAGGFIAADWFAPSVAALGKLSFEEHARLAQEFNGRGRWGYARSTGISYSKGSGTTKRGDDWLRDGTSRADAAGSGLIGGNVESPKWLERTEGDHIDVISEKGSTAQVDPLLLCQFLLHSCLDRGVQLHHPARALSVGKDMQDELSSICILNTNTNVESNIPCRKILIAAGAWSPQLFSTLFPNSKRRLPLSSLAGYSLIVRSPVWGNRHEASDCHAVFTTEETGYSPELFSRVSGEIYIAGLNSSAIALPNLPGEEKLDEEAVRTLQRTAQRFLVTTANADHLEIVRKGLCFRPVTAKGTPILGSIPDPDLGGTNTKGAGGRGVWLAAGHGPWGISLSLGTGKVMAEMIEGKPTSASVSGLEL